MKNLHISYSSAVVVSFTVLLFIFTVNYATAAAEIQTQQQQQQYQKQHHFLQTQQRSSRQQQEYEQQQQHQQYQRQPSKKAEVNVRGGGGGAAAGQKPKFGTKIKNNVDMRNNFTYNKRYKSDREEVKRFLPEDSIAPNSLETREHKGNARGRQPTSSSEESIAQYDIPIVEKVPQSKVHKTIYNRQQQTQYRHQQQQQRHQLMASLTPNSSSASKESYSSSSSSSSAELQPAPQRQRQQQQQQYGKQQQPLSANSPLYARRNNSRSRATTTMIPINNSKGKRVVGSHYNNTVTAASGSNVGGFVVGSSSASLTAKPSFKNAATRETQPTTTTPPRLGLLPNFPFGNPFSIFTPEFWGFSSPSQAPPVVSTHKPPKKYTPPPPPSETHGKFASREEKVNYQRFQKPTTPTKPATPTTLNSITNEPKKDNPADGPFKIALPTLQFFNPPKANSQQDDSKDKEKRATAKELRSRFECPRESEVRFQLFPKICKIDEDCSVWQREELCCDIFGAKSCVSGIPKPLEESSHSPILGLIPRKCPSRPLAELWWEVKECKSDDDCWPRVCCPDGQRRYCRTSEPELDEMPVPVPVKRSYNYLTEYLECTPPPPPIFDLHPKACTSTFDCFPNVCCQEAGLRHCRPPKKSLLALMANVFNVDFVKRITQNIVIK